MKSILDPIEYRKRESFSLREPGEEEEGPHPEEPDLGEVKRTGHINRPANSIH